jgi:hypothetical protein
MPFPVKIFSPRRLVSASVEQSGQACIAMVHRCDITAVIQRVGGGELAARQFKVGMDNPDWMMSALRAADAPPVRRPQKDHGALLVCDPPAHESWWALWWNDKIYDPVYVDSRGWSAAARVAGFMRILKRDVLHPYIGPLSEKGVRETNCFKRLQAADKAREFAFDIGTEIVKAADQSRRAARAAGFTPIGAFHSPVRVSANLQASAEFAPLAGMSEIDTFDRGEWGFVATQGKDNGTEKGKEPQDDR